MESPDKAPIQSGNSQEINNLIEKYQKILQSTPSDSKTLVDLQKIFLKIIELDPKNFDAIKNLGIILAQTGKLEQSIERLETAVKLRPDNVKAWNNLSEAYRRTGNYHKANACRMRAIQLNERKV